MKTNWLSGIRDRVLGTPTRRPRPQRRRSSRPVVELLEERLAPATIAVNTTADIGSPPGFTSLRMAIDEANVYQYPTEIDVPSGTYVLDGSGQATPGNSQLTITNNVTIVAELNNGPVTIETSNGNRAFTVQGGVTATFEGVTFDGGNNPLNLRGAAMMITGGANVNLDGVTFQNNAVAGGIGANAEGGALYIDDAGGTVTASQCTFTNNTATGGAGVTPDPYLAVNGGAGYGGAVALVNGQLQVSGSTFSDNSAAGGAAATPPLPSLTGPNGGEGAGGAIYVTGNSTLSVNDSTSFTGNQATGGAGASDLQGGSGGVGRGGAIAIDSSSPTSMSDSTFTGNMAQGGAAGVAVVVSGAGGLAEGGAIDYRAAAPLTLDDVTLQANGVQGGSASDYGGAAVGGAVAVLNAPVDVAGSAFEGNAAFSGRGFFNGQASGGGLVADDGATVTGLALPGNGLVVPTVFTLNSAFGGPGTGLLQADDGSGSGGVGGTGGDASGGGLYLGGGNMTLTDVSFRSNRAFAGNGGNGADFTYATDGSNGGNGGNGGNAYGGAVRSVSSGTLTITDTTFEANLVLGGRGGLGGNGAQSTSDGGTGGGGGNGGNGGTGYGGAIALSAPAEAVNPVMITGSTFVDNRVGAGDGGNGGNGSLGGSGSSSSSNGSDTFSGGLGGNGGNGGNGGSSAGGAIWDDGSAVTIQTSAISNNEARAGWGGLGGLGGPGSYATSFDYSQIESEDTDGGNGGSGGAGGAGGTARGGGIAVDGGTVALYSSSVVGNAALAGFGGDGLQGGNGGPADQGGTDGSGGHGGNAGNGGAARGGGVMVANNASVFLFNATVANNSAQAGGAGQPGVGGGPATAPIGLYPSPVISTAIGGAVVVGGSAGVLTPTAAAVGISIGITAATTTLAFGAEDAVATTTVAGLAILGAVVAAPLIVVAATPVIYIGVAAVAGGVAAAIAAANGNDPDAAFVNLFTTLIGPPVTSGEFDYNPEPYVGSSPDSPGVPGAPGAGGTDGSAQGGGIYVASSPLFTPVLDDTIIAGNTATNRSLHYIPGSQFLFGAGGVPLQPPQYSVVSTPNSGAADVVAPQFTSNGRNLVGVAPANPSAYGFTASDQVGSAASPLSAGFWPAQTDADDPGAVLAYYPGPAAIGAGGSQLFSATDQLGQPRNLGGSVDLGAVQVPGLTATVSPAAGQSNPTGNPTIRFTVVFDQPLADLPPSGTVIIIVGAPPGPTQLPASDFQVGGTAGGSVQSVTALGDNRTFTVTVSGMTQSGTVTLTIPSGAVNSIDGMGNSAASGTVTFEQPTASMYGPGTGVADDPLGFGFSAGNVAPDEAGGNFTYTVNWGDGTAQSPDVQTFTAGASGATPQHTYAAAGTYAAQVWATDKDGAESAPASVITTVGNASEQGGMLTVGGGGTIQLTPGRAALSVDVSVNGQAVGEYDDVTGSITIYGGGRTENISVSPAIDNPVTIFGGFNGNDTLEGGGGYNTLYGSLVGSNTFLDNGGYNTFVAGSGSNTVIPAGGNNTYASANNQPVLTVTAYNVTRPYGLSNPPFNVGYNGFLGNDGHAMLGGTLGVTSPATAASAPGTYLITPTGLTSSKYTIVFIDGTLTVQQAAATSVVTSSATPAAHDQAVTFTAAVTGAAGMLAPTGTVQFQIDGKNVGAPVPLGANGTATYSTAFPGAGSHSVTAVYCGDGNYMPSTAPTLTQVVLGPGATLIGTVLYLVGGNATNDNISITPSGPAAPPGPGGPAAPPGPPAPGAPAGPAAPPGPPAPPAPPSPSGTGVTVQANLNNVAVTTTYSQTPTAIYVIGYAGNDNITVAPTLTVPTFISAGNGNDNLNLAGGDNTVTLGNGNDNMTAGNGDNTLTLGNGNDNVKVGDGNNVVVTGSGNDNITAGNGDNLIAAGLGRHTVQAGNGQNILIDGSVSLTSSGDSLRQVLDDWEQSGAAAAGSIRSRLAVTLNSSYANTMQAGRGLDWFWDAYAKDKTNRKPTDLLN